MSWPRIALAVVLALLAGEGAMRLFEEPRNSFSGAFRPMPYYEDSVLGVAFGPPNYHGMMALAGQKQTWIALDDQGLRRIPSQSAAGAPSILVIGGASQTFGFGLTDEETWPARVAQHLSGPIGIHVLALPGTSIALDWSAARAGRGGVGKPTAVVIALYGNDSDFPLDTGPRHDRSLAIDEGRVIVRHGETANWITSSLLLEAVIERLEKAWVQSKIPELLEKFLERSSGHGAKANAVAATDARNAPAMALRDFVRAVGARTEPPDHVVVVTLPIASLAPDYYRATTALLPDSVPIVDLQASLAPRITPAQLFRDGHYRPSLADSIGGAVARALCSGTAATGPMLPNC